MGPCAAWQDERARRRIRIKVSSRRAFSTTVALRQAARPASPCVLDTAAARPAQDDEVFEWRNIRRPEQRSQGHVSKDAGIPQCSHRGRMFGAAPAGKWGVTHRDRTLGSAGWIASTPTSGHSEFQGWVESRHRQRARKQTYPSERPPQKNFRRCAIIGNCAQADFAQAE